MFETWTPLSSSNIQAIRYDESTRKLSVRFSSGSTYEYADVGHDTVMDFAHASSPGRFFASDIRDSYECTPL